MQSDEQGYMKNNLQELHVCWLTLEISMFPLFQDYHKHSATLKLAQFVIQNGKRIKSHIKKRPFYLGPNEVNSASCVLVDKNGAISSAGKVKVVHDFYSAHLETQTTLTARRCKSRY